ncbi:MAG: hypothetical protein J3R72DRAFT_461787 [Linnemannia gamsii]|nr:MAG: hypothetical protein J3R72DRAFT_461787 [Linnemannia gamsii]
MTTFLDYFLLPLVLARCYFLVPASCSCFVPSCSCSSNHINSQSFLKVPFSSSCDKPFLFSDSTLSLAPTLLNLLSPSYISASKPGINPYASLLVIITLM